MRPLLVLGWILVSGLPAAAETVKVASIEGVTEYRLANGARVLLFPEASRPTVTVNMTVLVGSRHEGYGESGMAHLLEHMVFKGTPDHPEVPKALRDHGASFNGTTNNDRTNYFETMPATDENLEFGIALESDRLVNSFVKGEDLQSEMTVVRNEFERGENNPGSILNQRIYAAAYEWHNYGKSTIGSQSDIERVPIENLQAFYKKYYQPDNVVLIVAGKFEEAKALALAEKYLGSIPKPTRKLDATYTEEPPQDGERTVTLRRVGAVGSVGVAYHVPSASHADWAPLSLLGGIISQSPNGRLYKALVESKLATSAVARSDNAHDPGLFFASASCEPEKLDAVRDALVKTLESLGDVPFTDDEVNKAKVRNKRNAEMLQSNSQAMAQALSSASSHGDWRLLFIQRDRVAAVTAADVNRVAKTYFQKPNRTVGVYIPARESTRLAVPNAPAIDLVVKDYKGGSVATAGEAFDPSPANLDARIKVVNDRWPEGRPVAQEESRRDGLARVDLALRQRRITQGPDDRGRDAPRPDDGRHEEARSPGAPRGARFAGHPHRHGRRRRSRRPRRSPWRRGCRCRGATDLLGRSQARHAAAGAPAARRDPPRAGLPRGGVRDLETPHGLDALLRPHRAGRPGPEQAQPRPVALPEG